MVLKHLLKTFATTFIIAAAFSPVSAQEDNGLLFGIYGGINTHSAGQTFLETDLFYPDSMQVTPLLTVDIPYFKNYSPSLGIFVNYPLTSSIDISGRLGYTNISGEFNNGIYGGVRDTLIEQDLSFSIHNVEFSPVVLFKNILLKDLYLLAGGEIGIPLSDSYSYTQRLITTSGNGDTTAMFAVDEPLSKNPVRLALAAGIGYNFNAGNIISIAPEISLRAPFTSFNISENITDIRVTQLRFTLNFTFLPETLQPIVERDLRVMIDTVGTYQSDGNFTLLKALKVEDVQYSEMYPLIPYVFYPKSEAKPIEEYTFLKAANERGLSSAPLLKPDALDINKQSLNIIGNA